MELHLIKFLSIEHKQKPNKQLSSKYMMLAVRKSENRYLQSQFCNI